MKIKPEEINHHTKIRDLESSGFTVECHQWRMKQCEVEEYYKKLQSLTKKKDRLELEWPTFYRKLEFDNIPKDISNFGGFTEIIVTTPEGNKFKAQSKCSPLDPFNHKKSLMITMGRIGKAIREKNFKDFVTRNSIQPISKEEDAEVLAEIAKA